MKNKQQTAIEWLENELTEWAGGRFYLPPYFFEKALEMEKNQIKNAYLCGLIHPLETEASKQAEQFYNDTYT